MNTRGHRLSPFFWFRFPPVLDLVRRILAIAVVITAPYALADDDTSLLGGITLDEKQPWHISADQLTYDDKQGQYIGKGNVVITKQGKKLTADFIRFNQKTMTAFAAGNVVMTVGNDTLSGSRMDMNLENETGTLYDGTIFISENHFYISGTTLQKLGEKTYAADEATVTACKGDNPDWKITGKNLKVDFDGVGVADHATLWTRKVPVLYTPFIAFPLRKQRESGLLFPQIGTSDRKGFSYNQPFFWAINKNSDATLYVDYMEERGVKAGVEYRYILDENSKGTVMFDGFDDRRVDDGQPGNDQWGYDDDLWLRPNSDRYWFRTKVDQALPLGFTAKLDLDIVSDQDYLQDFKLGYSGFFESDNYFVKNFGRDLNDFDDTTRLNRLNLNKTWSKFSFNAEARWIDNVVARRQLDNNPTIQKLPFLEFDASKQPVFGSPFFWDLDSEYVNFYRQDGDTAHRIDFYPRVYLPMNIGHYLSFEPSVGIRETVWYENRENDSGDEDETHHRHLYDVKADLSSEVFKIFRLKGDRVTAVKNTIRPQVVYTYISEEDQSDLPLYDGKDRIGDTHRLTYSLTTTFTSKTRSSQIKKSAQLFQPALGNEYNYNQFCRFKIAQNYDFDEDASDEPFSPITAELNFAPYRYFSMRGQIARSPYRSYNDWYNLALNLADNRGDRLLVQHLDRHDSSRSLMFDLHLKITDKLMGYAQYERDLFNDTTIRNGVGMLYQKDCWSIDFHYMDDGDKSFGFMVRLSGLGEFGQTFGFPTGDSPVEY